MVENIVKRILTFKTHKIFNLPILVLMPHSRCNCRCVMCDIWKANNNKKEITAEEFERHIDHFKKLNVREIVFSGGEALMHSNLWKLCKLLRNNKMRIILLSTGLLLEKNANEIIENIDEVIISLDGSQEIHDRIRNIPNGFVKLSAGIKALKSLKKDFRITGRSVLQRHNYFDFINTVQAAKKIELDQISFLAADVSSAAFNREEVWNSDRVSEVALTLAESHEFEKIIERSFIELQSEYAAKYIAENPQKMMRLVQYYKAVNGKGDFPAPICNAPWVSAVIESDGSVMPCFFHKPYGNIYDRDFMEIINSQEAVKFRRSLQMETDNVCKKCVCSLKLGLTQLS